MIRQAQTEEGVREKKVGWVGKEKGDRQNEAESRKEVGGNRDQPISPAGILYVASLILGGFDAVDLVEGQKGKKRMSQFMLKRTEPSASCLSQKQEPENRIGDEGDDEGDCLSRSLVEAIEN